MADRAADDHIRELGQLALIRQGFEPTWRQVANLAAPDAAEFEHSPIVNSSLGNFPQAPLAARRSKEIYDVTAINAVDRLSSGIEALVCPQAEYWHGYGVIDFRQPERTDEEKLWLEKKRNLVFQLRYDADSGFVPTIQSAIRRAVAFGNAFFYVDESFDERSMLRYSYLPLNECFAADNKQGVIDKFYRNYTLTARQALQQFGKRLPREIIRCAESPDESERRFRFLQCIHPRADYNEGRSHFAYKSVHVAVDERAVVAERGYYEFPVIDFRWLPEPGRTYGEGPIMRVLAEIQSVNLLAKNELVASEQSVKPPLLVANAGVMNRPNVNPGAINFGGLNPAGQELVKPLFTGQRLDFATAILEAKKNAIRESLYINLFQILVQNPEMSATEALIRANEKGELLGPAGSRFQGGLSRMVERELGILKRRGLYDQDSQYAYPSTFGGRVVVQFTSPMDRLRRSKEGEGIARLLEMVAPLAQIDPSVVDTFDPDVTIREMREILGAPVAILRDKETVAQIRAQRQEQQQMAQNAAIAEQLAAASAQGSNALKGAKEAGIF